MKVEKVQGAKGRFNGCQTTDEMRERMYKGEWLKLYHYGSGPQVEVRAISPRGYLSIRATAQPVKGEV